MARRKGKSSKSGGAKSGMNKAARYKGAPSGRRRAEAGDAEGRRAKSQQPVEPQATQAARDERERAEMTRERAEWQSERQADARERAAGESARSTDGDELEPRSRDRDVRDDQELFDRS
ncbi:MAG TPA: hypothetical protein VFT98_11735 [Myxococcota bacterium]|nr:hypothetical protein [Myxococcota bacterium]